jgi:hypothetical protein
MNRLVDPAAGPRALMHYRYLQWSSLPQRGFPTVSLLLDIRSRLCGYVVVPVMLAAVASGCGSSVPSGQPGGDSAKSLEDKVNPDDLYRYEGKGKAKRKVEVSRRERVKLLHEASKKAE